MSAQQAMNRHALGYCILGMIADLLTLLRLAIAVFVLILGMTVGPRGLTTAIIATFVGWVTDILDGPIARFSKQGPNWVSRMDTPADLALVYAFFLFLVIAGLFPLLPALIVMGLSVFVVLLRPTEPVVQMVSAPIFGLPIVLSFYVGTVVGICCCAFMLGLLILRWDRVVSYGEDAHQEATGANES